MAVNLTLYSDGGSRQNPGPAAAAYLLYEDSGRLLEKRGLFLGTATNNEAEYRALLAGLTAAAAFLGARLDCYLDSELVVRQLSGAYRIKEARLQKLAAAVRALEKKFAAVAYHHINRAKNAEADRLVNATLDAIQRTGVAVREIE